VFHHAPLYATVLFFGWYHKSDKQKNERSGKGKVTVVGDQERVFKLRKIILNPDEATPESSPTFVNRFQVSQQGSDVFLDAGIIALDDVLTPSDGEGVRFIVLHRLAMSPASLRELSLQLPKIVTRLRELGFLRDETTDVNDAVQVATAEPAPTKAAQKAAPKPRGRKRSGNGS
jgi:hypothetical protein